MKKILITGINSYVGCNLKKYLEENFSSEFEINCISLRDGSWKNGSFEDYDSIVHVAGLAHVDVDKIDEEGKQNYYQVNAELTEAVAKKAVAEGVNQFIFLSSIIVYSALKEACITKDTPLGAENFYGDSKIQAEKKLNLLDNGNMKIAILRPPMIYGKNSRGNYPTLSKLATKVPFFPSTKNKRSMLYIENLCEFIRLVIVNDEEGIFFPQNSEYSDTANVIREIGKIKGRGIKILNVLHWTVILAKKIPGKIGVLANKAFGDLYYDMSLSEYKVNYRICDLKESIKRTEG